LKEAENLLAIHGMDCAPLDQLHAMLDTLKYYDLEQNRISLDLGLSRGLQYYTGMIFEIHHGALGQERQLCGGGRYDDLVAAFGGRRDIPAVGFSYGLERLQLALESEEKVSDFDQGAVDVLVIPVSSDDYGYAIGVAEQLRHDRLRVEIDVRGRSVTSNFQYADKRDIPFAIVVGLEERIASTVVLKNMSAREEHRVALSDVAKQIIRMREYYASQQEFTRDTRSSK